MRVAIVWGSAIRTLNREQKSYFLDNQFMRLLKVGTVVSRPYRVKLEP